MQTLKLSHLWDPFFQETVIFHLIKKVSKKKIEITSPNKADLLVIGPHNLNSYGRKIVTSIKKRINLEKYFKNIDLLSLRSYQPLKVFYCTENVSLDSYKVDYYISHNYTLKINDDKYLRFPKWKEDIDWSHEEIFRDLNIGNAKRFGSWHKIEALTAPQGDEFLKKKREVCIFASHLTEPRKSFYERFLKEFKVDGFGPYFNRQIKNHNLSSIFKEDIMKNYSFNLCPENSMFPGWYTEKILDAFMGKCLPIGWADSNIKFDFNENAFVNLNDYLDANLKDLFMLLKDNSFLTKYTKEPLLLKKPNLDSEIKYIETILSNFQ